MLKLGKLADYGTMIVTVLAAEPERLYSAQDVATRTHVAAPTVSKLLKLLTKTGMVESLRGAHGGYKLARPAAAITVADVIAAIDGPIGLTQCSVHKGDCAVESTCGVRGNWRLINAAIHQALKSVTLADMAVPARRPGESRDPASFIVKFHKPLDSGLRRNDN
ncbi:MAG: SUF system Fe-S cluster assembly regulator [Gammaproteobacteria bacterium]